MPDTRFGLLPTMVGSMPHKKAGPASALVAHYLRDIPCWCQLPRRSFLENMYVQYSEGMPGAVIKEDEKKIYIDPNVASDTDVERLLTAYTENDIDQFPVSREYAAGLYQFLSQQNRAPLAVKGQVTGPVSFGLTVMDNTGMPVLYNETLADLATRLLRLKAGWQEKELRRISRNTIIFIDEPYLSSLGSAYVAVPKEKVLSLLEEVFGGIKGLKGLHCCGNTDWALLLGTRADILSFDTYTYAEAFSLYPKELGQFLKRGGAVAWGIVPNTEENLAKETVSSLKDRLEEAMAPFTRKGIPFADLTQHGLITPCCGLDSLPEEGAAAVLALLTDLSVRMRQAYVK